METENKAESAPVVWITGAAGGLGQGLVAAFLADGWRVAATYHRQPLEITHPRLKAFALAVESATAVAEVAAGIAAAWGRIDALVSNAGVVVDQLLGRLDEAAWDRVLDIDLKGPFLCAQAVWPLMQRQRGGHLLHVGSYSGRQGAIGQANYAAAKAGLLGLSASLAREGGPFNVRSNVVLPGVLPTGMTASLTETQQAAFARANALGRINSIAEVARFMVFLARMENVSGQVFQLDSRLVPWG